MTINEVTAFIVRCSDAERDAIVRALKSRRSILTVEAAVSFHAGDTVGFKGKRGYTTGTVLKVNRTTATVQEVGGSVVGMVWRVNLSALKPVAP
jgi:hypothetical protein